MASIRGCATLAVCGALAGFATLASTHAGATHTDFEFSAERFALVVEDQDAFVDEFDDASLDGSWQITNGTAVESGGVLTLRDPGTHDLLGLPDGGIQMDRSDVFLDTGSIGLDYSRTSFSATVEWESQMPAEGTFYGTFVPYSVGPATTRFLGIAIIHANAAQAAVLGIPSGPVVAWLRDARLPYFSSEYESWDMVGVPFDAGDLTGNVVMELRYDGTSYEADGVFSARASLDGGLAFLSLGSTPATNFDYATGVALIGDPMQVPEPSTGLLLAAALAGLGRLRRARAGRIAASCRSLAQ